jgi:hypothetical protein
MIKNKLACMKDSTAKAKESFPVDNTAEALL